MDEDDDDEEYDDDEYDDEEDDGDNPFFNAMPVEYSGW